LTDQLKSTKASRPRKQPVRYSLSELGGLLREAGNVYRLMRSDKMDPDKGRVLIWSLGIIRGMVEAQALERLERRLDEIAGTREERFGHGHTSTDQQTSRPN
jgi:hypothetical protein